MGRFAEIDASGSAEHAAVIRRRSWRSRCLAGRHERGASAVEFGLIAPVLILLTFAVIEFGLFLWGLTQAQTNVAAAVRTAGTQARVDGYEDQVADILRSTVSGGSATPMTLVVFKADPTTGRPTALPPGAADYAGCLAECWIFQWNASTKTWSKSASPSWPATEQRACGPSADTDFIGVWLQSRYNGATGFVLKNRRFTTRGIARLEPVPLSTGQQCKP